MTLILFEGPAGSGKTTSLVAAVRGHLERLPLSADQRVLGLTRYHGSRRRMHETLRTIPRSGAPVCQTVDSFAWHLVRRWRSLASYLGISPPEQDFEATVATATRLLKEPHVAAWVASTFPVVVLDEMQDCRGPWLGFVAELAGQVAAFAAADAFQDLGGESICEALDWAHEAGSVLPLSGNHRTNASGLLTAAHALREGQPLPPGGTGFAVQSVPKFAVAGGATSWKIKGWQRYGSIAILSPTKPGKSAFVRDLVDWVTKSTAKNRQNEQTAGPYPIAWESQDEEAAEQLAKSLGIRRKKSIRCVEMIGTLEDSGEHDLADWLRHQKYVLGRDSVETPALEAALTECMRKRRAFGTADNWNRRAMTIYQAKNREFESVIVLWPLRVAPNPEQQRRLLYNAITRAKRQALVLVEDPKKTRLGEPPFRASG